ncbi:hypothetical protein [Kitasatospora griseola]|uniref:hypothetical protein n=1 Tax=Kitasatospora griseola TaxID=2064 RepID=UPI0038304E97
MPTPTNPANNQDGRRTSLRSSERRRSTTAATSQPTTQSTASSTGSTRSTSPARCHDGNNATATPCPAAPTLLTTAAHPATRIQPRTIACTRRRTAVH